MQKRTWCRGGWILLALALGVFGRTAAEEPKKEEIFDVSQTTVPPSVIDLVAPIYPTGLKARGIEGSAKLEYTIDSRGRVVETKVIFASDPAFGEAAAEAVRHWRFKPGQVKGRSVNTRVAQQFPFGLSESDNPWTPIRMVVLRPKKPGDLPADFDWEKPPEIANNTREETVYPFEALQQGRKGKAIVRFIVGFDGCVRSMTVREATAPEFGHAALAVINVTWFQPAEKKDGQHALALVEATFDFKPNGFGDAPVRNVARDILRDLEKHPGNIISPTLLDEPLKAVSRPTATYPKTLAASRKPGEAVVEIFVDRKGRAQLPRIVSCTAPEFGYSAAQAVSRWVFEPPTKAGKPVITRMQVPFEFSVSKPENVERLGVPTPIDAKDSK